MLTRVGPAAFVHMRVLNASSDLLGLSQFGIPLQRGTIWVLSVVYHNSRRRTLGKVRHGGWSRAPFGRRIDFGFGRFPLWTSCERTLCLLSYEVRWAATDGHDDLVIRIQPQCTRETR